MRYEVEDDDPGDETDPNPVKKFVFQSNFLN